ncbi:MAG TPA: M48 family metallopeptidase [Gemmatimonadales bacterium]|nr:M48 family metallopeptidase [Gemmatimonadales bacterium]
MTNPNQELPARRPRTVLTQISSRAWEHAADRAALSTLRAIPGFDEVVRKVYGFFGERGVRLLFQANAVRVGPNQFPRVHAAFTDACATMDWSPRPDLFVSQTPLVNAGAFGMDHPFIVLNSGALALLDDEELRTILGHELGHVISGHALYRTILVIILEFGFRNLPFLAGIALLPIQIALLEWYRKSELSSDRAGLLASQDPIASMRMFMKLAGGGKLDEMNLDAFLAQAKEYEEGGDAMDTIYKVLNTLGYTHPFHTLRAAELQRWVAGGEYDRILRGEYPRRGSDEDKQPLTADLGEAGKYYADQARGAVDAVAGVAKKARDAFQNAFRGPGSQ